MESLLTTIANYLWTQSWQIAVLAVVVALVSWALRNRSAHVRYLLWLLVLAKCLTPPLLEVPLAVLPERGPPAVASIISTTPPQEEMAQRPVEERLLPTPTSAAPEPLRLTTRQWLAVGWLAGVALFAGVALTKAARTILWLRRERRTLPRTSGDPFEETFRSLRVKRPPGVWLIEGVGQPFVWGILRGDIYLPSRFAGIDDDEHRRDILAHEISHVLRFDAAVNILQIVAQGIFWFHPLLWWANQRIRREREKCCDEMAIVHLGARPKDYSSAIISTLIQAQESTRPVPSLAVAGPVKNIEERIRAMLKPGKEFYKHPSLPVAAVVVLMSILAVPTTVVLTVRAGSLPPTDSAGADRIFGNPTNLGPSVNSSADEYDPSISADELELYFNSYRAGGLGQADIWVTTRKTKADPWGKPVNLGPTVNSPAADNAPSISADGLSLYFSSTRPGGHGGRDIWATTRKTKSDLWSEPANLGPTVNSSADEHAPNVSSDGLELYFSGHSASPESARPGGSGEADLWVTTRKTTRDPWGTPVNLGPTVNSSFSDTGPSMSGDGLSLYFSSWRLGGYGSSDIWVTTRKSKSDPWGTPVNLGPTVNSANWESDSDISKDGSTLYFASDRPGRLGSGDDTDIWQVTLGKRPESTADSKAESEQPRFAARTFNAKTAFSVYVQETSESQPGYLGRYIGQTPSAAPLEIPACWLWSVHALGLVQDRDALIREIRESRVPGLDWDGVTDSDVSRLADLKELRHLGLTGNRITDAGLEQLRGLTRLESLILSSPHVTDAGLGHLRGLTGLQSLSLRGPKLTEAGVEQLIKTLPGLRALALPFPYQMTDAKLAHLPSLGKLRKLDLSFRETADAGLARLKDFTTLRELRLGLAESDVTDAGLAHLEGSTALRNLDLAGTKITDAGLAHLKDVTSLRDLDLLNTKITDAGLAHLKGLTKLQRLRLISSSGQITGACLQYLGNMTELQGLDMSSCPITDADLQHLKGLTGLLHLDVKGPGITDAGLEHLRGLTRLQRLFLRDAQITDAGLEHLKGLPDLQWLWLIGSGRITDASLEHLKGLTNLRNLSLSLDDAQITDGGLEHLKGLTGLQTLWVTNSQITDAGLVQIIKGMPQLTSLALAHSRITDAGLEQVGGLKGLRLLNLNDTQITDAGLEHLQGLTELTDLRLKNTKITDAGLEHLKDLTGLFSLYLNDTPITDAGLEHLKGLTGLGRLELSGTQVTDAGVQQLKRSLPGLTIYR
jgi:beta-lactamase regulating signal transducer with metallopeptidase domain/Leucine-rich repeat (LRR) protein/Tol biopolymer transport system component